MHPAFSVLFFSTLSGAGYGLLAWTMLLLAFERPGALMNFLSNLRSDWNISLFHYRNHGSDFGRVLVGMQVPPSDQDAFDAFLQRLGYDYVAVTDNPAYRLFLSGS